MSNVVAINGAEVHEIGAPDENLIALLERHLADAKSGKTVAVAVCSVDAQGWVLAQFDMNSHRFTLLGALNNLQHKLNKYVDEADE